MIIEGIAWNRLDIFDRTFPPRLPRPNVHQVPIVSSCLPNRTGGLEAEIRILFSRWAVGNYRFLHPEHWSETGWPPPNILPILTLARSQWGPVIS